MHPLCKARGLGLVLFVAWGGLLCAKACGWGGICRRWDGPGRAWAKRYAPRSGRSHRRRRAWLVRRCRVVRRVDSSKPPSVGAGQVRAERSRPLRNCSGWFRLRLPDGARTVATVTMAPSERLKRRSPARVRSGEMFATRWLGRWCSC